MEPLLFTLCIGLSLGHLVFILFHTDAFEEYARVFKIPCMLTEYAVWKNKNVGYYPQFIRERYSGFWSKLFGCPFCLSTFSAVVVSIIVGSCASALPAAYIACVSYLVELALYNKNFSNN